MSAPKIHAVRQAGGLKRYVDTNLNGLSSRMHIETTKKAFTDHGHGNIALNRY